MWFHIQIESVNILQTVVIDWLCVNQISILHATNRSNAKTSKQLKITDIKSLYALWCRSQHIVNAYIAYFDGNYIIMTFCDFQFLSSFFSFFLLSCSMCACVKITFNATWSAIQCQRHCLFAVFHFRFLHLSQIFDFLLTILSQPISNIIICQFCQSTLTYALKSLHWR